MTSLAMIASALAESALAKAALAKTALAKTALAKTALAKTALAKIALAKIASTKIASSLRIIRTASVSITGIGRTFRGRRVSPSAGLRIWVLLGILLPGIVAGAQTTISGHVYVPNAVDPLPNALVYVTTGTVAPFVSGANCPGVNCLTASTAVPANAIVATYTAVDGSFTLSGVPENTTYTLVIQAGKWRRQFAQAVVASPITGLVLDMPTTHAQGDIPLIAIATGAVDAVECVLRDVGVLDAEFTDDNVGGGGRIHLYKGDHSAGSEINASTPTETTLMGTPATLDNYDMVMFPCQGNATLETAGNIDNLLAYTSAGGRAFATHYSKVFLNTSETVASGPYAGATFMGVATWTVGSTNLTNGPATINTGFTDGATLAQWLQDLGESSGGTLGQVALANLRHDLTGVTPPTQTWLTLNSGGIMQLTFNTPVGAAAAGQYGRVLYNEYHVEDVTSDTGSIFPAECGAVVPPASMSPQEKMLEYALFDLSNFVTPVIVPSITIGITTNPSNSIFTEGDTADTITVDVTNTSGSVALDDSIVLTVTLPSGLTASAMTDMTGGWICTASTLTCTRITGLATGASDSAVITVAIAGNATGGAASTMPSVSAEVSSPTFSANVTAPLTITLEQHADATWATPEPIADGTPLSATQLNAVGNTAGTYVYTPPAGTVLGPGSHMLSVAFTPTNQELYPGTATVTVNLVVDSPTAATASAPQVTNFGSVPVATASASQIVTFTFLTPGDIGSPVVVTEVATGADFTDALTGTCDSNGPSYVYSATNTCTVNVIFTPAYPGTRYGAVLLEDQSGNVLATAYLYGVGTGPQVNFLPGTQVVLVTNANGITKPQGLALDGSGNLYTADYTNHAVYRTTAGGVTSKILDLSAVGAGGTPECLAVDGAGNLYIGDSNNNQVLQATPSGSGYALNPSPVATGLNSSGGVAVDQSGNVYIADTNNNRILREDLLANGSYEQLVVVSAATSLLGTTLNTPFDVAVDTSGNVYISDTLNNRVLKETYSEETYTPSLVAGGLDWPTQLVVDGEGNVYFANNGHSSVSNSHVYKETPDGGSYTQSVVPSSLTVSNVWGVAVAGNGNVYLSDVTDTEVIEEKFATAPSLNFAATNVGSISSDSPQAVTVENVGNMALVFTASGLVAPTDFSQVAGSGSPVDCADSASVGAGASCDLSIKFAPTIAGNPLSESFALADNSLNASPATQNIGLSGHGVAISLTLSPVSSTLTGGTAGVPYGGVTFTASGGTGPYSYSYTGTLPPGLTLSGTGLLSGTPSTAGGPYSFTVIATDSESVTGSQAYSLTISPGTATVTLGSLAQTYTGSPLAATATTNPAELTVGFLYTGTGGTTYGPSSTPPTSAGSYTVVGTVSNPNYAGTSTGTLVIAKATATIILSDLAQTYTGSPLAATVTTSPAELTVGFLYTGTDGTTYGPSSTPPTLAGSYTVVGTISNANYIGSTTETLVIAKATATIILSNLAQTYTGSSLAATAVTSPAELAVNLTYDASATAPIAAGRYAVVAVVVDNNYSGTTMGTLVIGPAAAIAAVASSVNPALAQITITFTATISSSAGTPTGMVNFLDGSTSLGEGMLASGMATLSTSSLTAGSHAITAVYGGLGNFAAASSATLTEEVLNFSLNPAPGSGGGAPVTSQTAVPGGVATYPLTIVPTAGIIFPTPMLLTVTGMPAGATAAITPASFTQLSPTSWSFPADTPIPDLSLMVTLPAASASLSPASSSSSLTSARLDPGRGLKHTRPQLLWGTLLLPLAFRLRRAGKNLGRTACLLLGLIAGTAGIVGLTSCGTSGFFAPQGKIYTITVTATSGTLSHSTELTLTVQ